MKKIVATVVCAVAALLLCTQAHALDFDFSGIFSKDNDIVQLNFSVGAASTATIFSSSWAGGGFDPILAIWEKNGNLAEQQDDGMKEGDTMSNGVMYHHGLWDSYFEVDLSAGDYVATIAQYSNFPNGSNLNDGFRYDGDDAFTNTLQYGSQPYFNGVGSSSDPRTGDWEFHILGVESASNATVPEPATMLLLGIGLVGFAGVRRRIFKQK